MSRFARWLREEPVRVYLYTVAVAVLLLLVGIGVVTATMAPLILGVVAAVLAIPGTESLRSRVTPWHGDRRRA